MTSSMDDLIVTKDAVDVNKGRTDDSCYESLSDEAMDKVEISCNSCENDRQTIPANGFCLECSEYLCNCCIKNHRKLNLTINHVIKEGKDMPRDQVKHRGTKQILVDPCPDHIDRFIEYYCQSCDKLCCNACVHSGHRECKKVNFIPDIVKDADFSTEENDFVKKTAKLNDGCNRQTDITENNSKAYLKCSEQALSAVSEQEKKVIAHFDKLKKEIGRDVNKYSSENKAIVEKASGRCMDIKTRLGVLTTKAQEKEGPRQAVQRYIQMKRSRDELAKLETDFTMLEKDNHVTRKQYVPLLKVTEILSNVQQLGQLEVRDPEKRRETRFDRDISIKTSEQTNSKITAITILSDARLLAVDESDDNVTLINPQTSRVKHCLQSKLAPHDVARVSNRQAIATFPDEGKLKYIDLASNDKLSYGQEIDVGKECQGIAYAGDKFVVSFKNMADSKGPGNVKVVDMAGHILQDLSTDQSGNALFKDPCYLTLSMDLTLLYIADEESMKVLCLTMNGIVLNKLDCQGTPPYLAVSSFDSVFLCGSEKIFQVLPGSGITTDVTEAFEYPYSVACWHNTMYVGTNHGVIKVYTIV